mgnify:CR=1 FL=1
MMSISYAPLPTLSIIFKAITTRSLPDTVLSEKWCKPPDKAYWFSRSAWSFVTIVRLKHLIENKPFSSIYVWIPDFFCNMSLELLRNMGVNLIFYPIKDDLFPDEEACYKIAHKIKLDLFLFVHYFGIPIIPNWLTDFCKQKKAWLIEDAVHALYPFRGIGEFGDFVLYSPYKLLPMPDGAIMIIRKGGPNNILSDTSIEYELNKIVGSLYKKSGFSEDASLIWLAKRVLQMLGLRGSHKTPFMNNSNSTHIVFQHPKMTSLAKSFLSLLIDLLDSVASIRKHNLQTWYFYLSAIFNKEDLNYLNDIEYIPYLACLVCNNEKTAERIYRILQEMRLPVMTWPDLPPETVNSPEIHNVAIKLRRTRIYLPVHESVSKKQIEKFLNRLRGKSDKYISD